MRFWIIGFFIIFIAEGYADTGPINEDMQSRISDGISISPILGYNPTYGMMFGLAVFRGDTEPPVNNLDTRLYTTLKKSHALEASYTAWSRNNTFFRVETEISSYYDSYFGEGNDTDPSAETQIDKYFLKLVPSYWYRWTREFSGGVYSELRYRSERAIDGDSTRRLFDDEFTPVFGVAIHYDTRDHQLNSKSGSLIGVRTDVGPGLLSTRVGAENFIRLEAEGRQFFSLTDNLVLGTRGLIGMSAGDSGYLYRYSLGGTTVFRGFRENRFRGQYYYLGQLELRFQANKWVGLVGFTGLGDTADRNPGDFGTPRFVKGVGLRIGLPPDFVAMARLDFGWADDESTFSMNFNQAF